MPRGWGKNSQLILELLQNGPSTKENLLSLFDEKDHHSVAISLARLTSGDAIINNNGTFCLKALHDTETKSTNTHTLAQGTSPLDSLCVFKKEVSVPEVASTRRFSASFQIIMNLPNIRRAGFATECDENRIFWFPQGAKILTISVGDTTLAKSAELMQSRYLCLVRTEKGRNYIEFYQPPYGHNFVLAWEE